MRTLLAALCVAAVVVAAPVPKVTKKRPDAERLEGVWDIVVAELNGQPFSKATWTFVRQDGGGMKMYSAPPGSTERGTEYPIRLDPAGQPKEIDIGTLQGIYAFDGDDLRISYSVKRPTGFDPAPGVHYQLLRRRAAEK